MGLCLLCWHIDIADVTSRGTWSSISAIDMVSFLLSNLSEVLNTSWAFQPLFVLVALILGFMYSNYLNLLVTAKGKAFNVSSSPDLVLIWILHEFWRSSDITYLQMFYLTVSCHFPSLALQLLSFSLAACNSFLSVSLLFSLLLLLLLLSLLFHSQQFCCKSFNFLGYSFHIPAFGF